ncbi:MAG TPA: PVC-type heme-binding CxxCH protein [Tepidisphaeraceae bacterium]|nr:PVC-type heme-binding CxxCH protein [Tepidisphaeraceae bacterium]
MHQRKLLAAAISAALGLAGAARAAEAPKSLPLQKGDHICIIGNGLADGLQHDGWLETMVYSRFPKDELVFRNMGFGGDEVVFRDRSDNFGTPDQWLTKEKADVVLAFFGYNEAWAGKAGLEKYKGNLTKFIKDTLASKYNGKAEPKLVIFSPIAHEDIHNPNYPDGKKNNEDLKLYSDAMAQVASANGVLFVDLFTPSQKLFADAKTPLTMDGVHLSAKGDKALAPIILHGLFPDSAARGKVNVAAMKRLREAINEKNFYFFEHYDTVDGYNVYGGRSSLVYNGVSNFAVMQRELEVLDVMCANRDKRVWAVAQGGDLKVDDSNTPPFIPVPTNHPNNSPDLDPQAAIAHMKVPEGMRVELVASEKDTPALANPVQMAWDTQGRLFVCAWPNYPHWKPKDPFDDKVLIFSDFGTDGKAGKTGVFLDHLNCPTGMEFYNNGLLVAQAPYMIYARDTTGGDKPNVMQRVLSGIDSADTHHTENSFVLDPGGALYYQEGTFLHSQVENVWGPPARNQNAGVYRYEPRTGKFEPYACYGFANPHGHVFNNWGTDIIIDGTGAVPYYGPTISGKKYFPDKHSNSPTVYRQRTRPCPGAEILSSPIFPEKYNGNLLVANVIGMQGILDYKLEEKDSGLVGTEVEPLLQSDDPNFRPVDIKIGPDGAIYFCDWYNPLIGHMQHHLRDPSRDHTHGRIYRIVPTDHGLRTPAQVAGAPIEALLDLLKDPEDRTRSRAKIELGGRDSKQVIATVDKWMAGLDAKDANYQHNLMEALWVYQYHNVVNQALLEKMLASPNHHARAAATRVLCYWRDRVKDPLKLLRKLVNDNNPRVRLEAVRACSFFTVPEAQDVALDSLNKPQDKWLKYELDDAMKTLDKVAKGAKQTARR